MLLSSSDKIFLIKLLKKQRVSLLASKKDRHMANELMEKLEQNLRNEKLSDTKKSRL